MAEKKNIKKKAPELRKHAEHGIRRLNEGFAQCALERTAELMDSVEGYQTMFNTMIEGFCIIEVLFDAHDHPVDYRFLEVNPAFEAQTGLRNARGKRIRELAPDHEAYWFELYGKVAVTGAQMRFENEAKALNRWYDVSAYRVGGQDSRKVAILFNDITERKRTEEALIRSKAEWERTFDAVPDLIALIDRDYRIVRVNRAMAARAGCEPRQLVGATCFEAVHGLSAPPDFCPHAKLLLSGKEERAEVVEKRLNGTFDVTTTPLCDESGRVVGSVHVARDITERKLVEKALRESEHEKSLILENANEIIAYHDVEQNLIWANRAYQEATMPLSELKGRKCYSCWGLERLCINCPVSAAIRTGEPQSAELTPQNQPHWPADQGSWLVRAAPVKNSAGIVIGVIEIAHDITESKRTEKELRVSRDQLRELAASLQTVREEERTRVARDIHDELAQELTRLKIDLVWIKGRLLKPGKVSNVKALAARVEEMTQMADDAIQCVQKIATGLRPAVLDSLGLCAAVEWQARDFQVHTGISCNASLSEKELPIGGDIATAVFRILQESLTNVLRHANATSVDIDLRQEAGQLLLQVHDNGCGIPEEKLNSQLSIGLTDMKERALLLGGHFEVRSRPESGTTIEVRLPLEKNGNI